MLRYNPDRPDQARIASFSSTLSLWIVTIVTGILGAAFLLATWLAWWVFRRAHPSTRFDS